MISSKPVSSMSKELMEHVYNGGFLHCKDLHAHSCNYNTWLKFKTVFSASFKLYIPIHCIPVLIFKRKALA